MFSVIEYLYLNKYGLLSQRNLQPQTGSIVDLDWF